MDGRKAKHPQRQTPAETVAAAPVVVLAAGPAAASSAANNAAAEAAFEKMVHRVCAFQPGSTLGREGADARHVQRRYTGALPYAS